MINKPMVRTGVFGRISPESLSSLGFRLIDEGETSLVGSLGTASLPQLESAAQLGGYAFAVRDDFDRLFLPARVLDLKTPLPGVILGFKGAPTRWVVQFDGPVRSEWLDALIETPALGAVTLGRTDMNAAFVSFASALSEAELEAAAIAASPHVQRVVPYQPEWRLSGGMPAVGRVVDVYFFPAADAALFQKELQNAKALPVGPPRGSSSLTIQPVRLTASSSIVDLLQSDLVMRVDVPVDSIPADERAGSIVAGTLPSNTCIDYPAFLDEQCGGCLGRANSYRLANSKYPTAVLFDSTGLQSFASPHLGSMAGGFLFGQYTDEATTPTVVDGSLDTGAWDETGNDCSGHGSMVASMISGQPTSPGAGCDPGTGIAPGAKLFATKSYAVCWVASDDPEAPPHPPVEAFEDLNLNMNLKPKYPGANRIMSLDEQIEAYLAGFESSLGATHQARAVNNSWQLPGVNSYGSPTWAVDVRTRQSRQACIDAGSRNCELLFVFASGNITSSQQEFFDYCEGLSWDHSGSHFSSSPGISKNALTVGGTAGLREWSDVRPGDWSSRYEIDWTWNSNGIGTDPDARLFASAIDRARFSGAGVSQWPGRLKPDLMAPAVRIISTKSQDSGFSTLIAGKTRNDYLDLTYWKSKPARDLDDTVSSTMTISSGTSFSAPQAPGAAILVSMCVDYRLGSPAGWTIHRDPVRVWPSPDLVKAALIAHARSMVGGRNALIAPAGTSSPVVVAGSSGTAPATQCTTANGSAIGPFVDLGLAEASLLSESRLAQRPDPYQGWGLLNFSAVSGSLQGNPASRGGYPAVTGAIFGATPRFVANDTLLKNAKVAAYSVSVSDPAEPISIVVAWTDHPGAEGGTSGALVNNLDLEVVAGGLLYRGNCIDPATGYSRASCIAADGVNNVESVFLPPGLPAGTPMIVRVVARSVTEDCWRPAVSLTVGEAGQQDFGLYAFNTTSVRTLPGEIVATTGRCGSVSFSTTDPAAGTLTWGFGDGSASSSLAEPVHFYVAPGTYAVTATSSGGRPVRQAEIAVGLEGAEAPQPLSVVPLDCSTASSACWNPTPTITLTAAPSSPPLFGAKPTIRAIAVNSVVVPPSSVTVVDSRTVTFVMPCPTDLGLATGSCPSSLVSGGGTVDIEVGGVGFCVPVLLSRAFVVPPRPGNNQVGVVANRPWVPTSGGSLVIRSGVCGFKNTALQVKLDGVVQQACCLSGAPIPTAVTVNFPARAAGVSQLTVDGVFRRSASGSGCQTGTGFTTSAPIEIEFVDLGFGSRPESAAVSTFRASGNPSRNCGGAPIDERLALDCRPFAVLAADRPSDLAMTSFLSGGIPNPVVVERGRAIQFVSSTGDGHLSAERFPDDRQLPCPSGLGTWLPRGVAIDPFGKLLLVSHDEVEADGPGWCGGDPIATPLTLVRRTSPPSYVEIGTRLPVTPLPNTGIEDASHPVDATFHAVALAAKPTTEGSTFTWDGGTAFRRRFGIVSQSGPVAARLELCGPPLPPLGGAMRMPFSYPLVLAGYDLNETILVPNPDGSKTVVDAPNPQFGRRTGWVQLDTAFACSVSPPAYPSEMGLDVATDGQYAYVVAPIAGKLAKISLVALEAGNLAGNCTEPACSVLDLGAGVLPSDVVVARQGNPAGDALVVVGAGDDRVYRVPPDLSTIDQEEIGSLGFIPIVPTAVAVGEKSLASLTNIDAFVAGAGSGEVAKVDIASLVTTTTIPLGTSVTRVGVLLRPDTSGLIGGLKSSLQSAPTNNFGNGTGGGQSAEQSRRKLLDDAADVEEALQEESQPSVVEATVEKLIRDAEALILDEPLRVRVIQSASSIPAAYVDQLEGE